MVNPHVVLILFGLLKLGIVHAGLGINVVFLETFFDLSSDKTTLMSYVFNYLVNPPFIILPKHTSTRIMSLFLLKTACSPLILRHGWKLAGHIERRF